MHQPFSLYFHIPYCRRKCPYCDFNVHVASNIPEDAFVQALVRELSCRSRDPAWQGRILQSIYFGGGTPSVLSAASLGTIVKSAQGCFQLAAGSEIGMEMNPEDAACPGSSVEGGVCEPEKYVDLKRTGFNRISLGVQSFSDRLLKRLGRRHSQAQVEEAVRSLRASGFDNISFDLIFGIPKQSLSDFDEDIRNALALAPAHISLYGLTIEEGTPFCRDSADGKLLLPSEETFARMMERGEELLSVMGYQRYEISNYAVPGFESKHNLSYWNGDDYLGIGPGAHSFVRQRSSSGHGVRFANYSEPSRYMSDVEKTGMAEAWRERLGLDEVRFEFFFMGLRKVSGVSSCRYRELFAEEMKERYGESYKGLNTRPLSSRLPTGSGWQKEGFSWRTA